MYYIDNLMTANDTAFSAHIKKCDRARFRYWQRALLQRVQSVYKINGIPDNWKGEVSDYLDHVLIMRGFAVVHNNPAYGGTVFSAGTLSGFNYFYQPVKAMLYNPVESGKQLTIGVDCELIRFTPDYFGVFDIISRYAEELAMLDTAVKIAIKVCKTPYILGGKNKAATESLKAIVKKIDEGDFACFYDQAIADNAVAADNTDPFQHLELFKIDNYILDKLLDARCQLINDFDAEVGIPSVPYEKKERLVTAEATSRKLDSTARARVWIETLNASFEKVNKMFGTSLSAELTVDEFEDNDDEEEDNYEEDDSTRTAE